VHFPILTSWGCFNFLDHFLKTSKKALELLWNRDSYANSKDTRRLSELCTLWYELHGKNLKDAGRLLILQKMCERLGDPSFNNFDKKKFAAYRATVTRLLFKLCAASSNNKAICSTLKKQSSVFSIILIKKSLLLIELKD
jgi:hypothetical protein